jgi:hypothetical protein
METNITVPGFLQDQVKHFSLLSSTNQVAVEYREYMEIMVLNVRPTEEVPSSAVRFLREQHSTG